MMASGLLAAAVLATPAQAAPPVDSRNGHAPKAPARRNQHDLYSSAPRGMGAATTTGRFIQGYQQSLSVDELMRGTRMGELTLAPQTASAADRRAGLGDRSGSWRWPVTVAIAALLAAAALALGAPARASAALPDGFAGVSTEDAYTGAPSYQAQAFAKQRKTGFTIVRQVFRWQEIETVDNGHYDFSATDRFVLAAAKAKIRVLPVLFGEPTWASSRPAGNVDRATFPPADPAIFGRFAAQVASRYGPVGTLWDQHKDVTPVPITSYQLWNEPNLPLYWGGRPNAAAYAKLLIAGAAGLRSVDAQAYVVSGGIPDSKLGQKPGPFVKRMLAAGAGPALNAVGIHPYAASVSQVVANTKAMRKAVDGAGGRSLALWATEFGWGAGGPASSGRTFSAKRQGELIAGAFKALAAKRRSFKLRGAIYFAWRDSAVYPGGHDFWGLHTGLLDRAGHAKPSLRRVAAVLPHLR